MTIIGDAARRHTPDISVLDLAYSPNYILSRYKIASVARCFFDIDQVTSKTHGVMGAEDASILRFTVQRKANHIQMWQKRQMCPANYWIIQLSQK